MAKEKIVTHLGKGKDAPEVTVEYDFGTNFDNMVEVFGEDVVFKKAKAQIIVDLQAYVRTQMKNNVSPADLQKKVNDWKPGLRQPGKSKAEKIREQFAGLTSDEKKALLASLGK